MFMNAFYRYRGGRVRESGRDRGRGPGAPEFRSGAIENGPGRGGAIKNGPDPGRGGAMLTRVILINGSVLTSFLRKSLKQEII